MKFPIRSPRDAFARRSLLSAAVAIGLIGSMPARANDAAYPERPVKLIIPYTPGGATDVIGRAIGQNLSVKLGQPVVVENRAGATGSVGATAVAREKPDGYTLLLGALTSHSISSVLYASTVQFDMEKSFAPVSIVGRVPLVITVGPSVKATSLADFIALAKSKPGQINFGSSGNGSPQHLAAELFQREAGVKLTHIPYKSSAPVLNDLMGGQIDMVIDTLPATQPFIKSGRIRALATATPQRLASLPDVPTAEEAGVKGVEVSSMFGLLAPAGTPLPIITKLNAALKDIMSQQDVKASLAAQGAMAIYTTPDEARQQIRDEVARWTRVIKEANIKPE